VDLTISMMAHVLNDNQYSKPGAWQPHVGPGQADLEGHLITRRMQVSISPCALPGLSLQKSNPLLYKLRRVD